MFNKGKKGLRLKDVFYVTLIAIAVLYLASSLPSLYTAWQNVKTAKHIELLNGVSNDLFQAVRNYGFERGRVNVVLNDAGPVAKMEKNRKFILARREEGDQALKRAIEKIGPLSLKDKERLLKKISNQKNKVAKLRQRAAGDLVVPKSQRDPALSKIWFGAMTELIKQLEGLLVLISQGISDNDGVIARLYALQHKALALRNTSGPEMSILSATILSKKPIKANLIKKIEDLQVRTALHFEDLERLAAPLSGAGIIKAFEELKEIYTEEYLPVRAAVFPAALTGGPYPYTQPQFLSKGVKVLESIADFMDAVVTVTNTHAKIEYQTAVRELIVEALLTLGTLGLVLVVLIMVHFRVIKPVTKITGVMSRLASDDLDVDIPAADRHDEVGDMARAVEVFKENSISLKEDMAARRKAEAALRRSEAILATAQRIAQIGSWELELQTGRLIWSDEMYRLTETLKDGSQPETDALWRLASEKEKNLIENAFRLAESEGRPYDLTYSVGGETGQERVFHEIVDPVVDQRGQVVRLYGTVQDITERRKLEARVQQAQKLESLGLVAGGVAHDFNNILAGILGFAELCLNDVAQNQEAKRHLHQIIKLSQRAAELAKQMLSYAGRGAFRKSVIDISDTVGQMVKLLGASLSKKHRLHLDLPSGLPKMEGDQSQINQVIMNLLTNASESLSDSGGEINVHTGIGHFDRPHLQKSFLYDGQPPGDYLFLEVMDTGQGIDLDHLEKIFDPFFTTKFIGRGLGLAVVLGIVRGHRGIIIVESKANSGARFLVLFPQAKEAETNTDSQPMSLAPDFSGQGRTVLIVDDEAHVREIAAEVLAGNGFKVITAANGQEGVERFKGSSSEIDLVILDMIMPDMNGDEVLQQLVRERSDIKVIIASGYSKENFLDRFESGQIAAFIQKPWRIKELLQLTSEVIRQSH